MREGVMASWTDFQVLDRIQRLAWEAHGLYARHSLDGQRLFEIRTELDRCWNLLRQRLALPDEGRDRADSNARTVGRRRLA
jgi:hypothetical protein